MSVDKRPNGTYRVRWREADGRQRARHFDRRRDAEVFEATVRVDLNRGTYVDPDAGKLTVGEFAHRWAASQPWRQSSRDRVDLILRNQISPAFGPVPLRSVRTSDVQAWVGRMTASGLAPSTVVSYFRCLAAIMLAARRDRLIHETPCEGVRLPRARRNSTALVPLTSDQVWRIAESIAPRYRALVIVSATLALRQGEACGLTVDRIDFLRRRVRVDRQLLSPTRGPVSFGPPKTPRSNRVLPLPPSVGDVVAAHLAEFGHGPDGLIFTSSTGAPLRRSTWGAAFTSAAKRLGVDSSPHDLRHHGASLLIADGCSVKAVQSFLGHATAAETLDTYSHLWPSDEERIVAAIERGLAGNEDSLRTANSSRSANLQAAPDQKC